MHRRTPMSEALIAWLNAGQQALEVGDFPVAIAAFTRVCDAMPSDVSVAIALANVHRLGGDVVTSRRVLLQAHERANWTEASLAHMLGAALLEVGAAHEAVACFEQVVRRLPSDPAALGALAGGRRTLGQPAAAWPLIEQAVKAASTNAALLLTAAQIRHDLRDLRGAAQWLDRAEAIRPNHGPTRVQRAYTSLLAGTSAAGWQAFESRPLPEPNTHSRPWQGEPLLGGSVLVTAEQGVGDQFQFARFISLLTERGAGRVVVECHADAVALFVTSGFDAIPRGSPPETDWHVPMMSLPFRLGTDGDVLGDRVPYLRSGPTTTAAADTSRFERRAGTTRSVGLVWGGNPSFPGRVTRDFDASLLPELLAIPGIDWISLQQGDTAAVTDDRLRRVPLSTDWRATAALLSALDGLVTTDTGIAHLAGAMGIRTWVLLQHVPDWRWGGEGETTPWYPTLRLLRPRRWNDWRSVLEGLQNALIYPTDSSSA